MKDEFEVPTAVVVLVFVLAAVAIGAVLLGDTIGSTTGQDFDPEEDVVTLEDGSELWPYTSRSPSFADQTLSINLLFYGEAVYTEQILREVPAGDWEDLPEDRQDLAPAEGEVGALNETTVAWGAAAGANRWIWVEPVDGDPLWLSETYQLEQGDYLGERIHVRAYEDPSQNQWTAIQAHNEHWDWFHLRHTVHTIEESQVTLEDELHDGWFIEEFYRERFGNDRSADADGWVTIVVLDEELLPYVFGVLLMGLGSVASRTATIHRFLRSDPAIIAAARAMLLIGTLVAAYLGVRFATIGLERQFPTANPKLIIAFFYPLLIGGLPALAYITARKLEATVAFWAGTIGFVGAVMIDYTYLGVLSLPIETFVHRIALAVAIGLIAAGASYTAREPTKHLGYIRTGLLLWIVAVSIPLIQFV